MIVGPRDQDDVREDIARNDREDDDTYKGSEREDQDRVEEHTTPPDYDEEDE